MYRNVQMQSMLRQPTDDLDVHMVRSTVTAIPPAPSLVLGAPRSCRALSIAARWALAARGRVSSRSRPSPQCTTLAVHQWVWARFPSSIWPSVLERTPSRSQLQKSCLITSWKCGAREERSCSSRAPSAQLSLAELRRDYSFSRMAAR